MEKDEKKTDDFAHNHGGMTGVHLEKEVEAASDHLVDAVLHSEVYLEYRKQLARVKAVPGLKPQIDEFRRRNFELQQQPDYAFDKLEQFEREYGSFREDPLVSDFLAAELAFCRMMQDLGERLLTAADFE